MSKQQPTPITADLNASAPQLLARAADDYAAEQDATHTQETQGGPGIREGILPGGEH